MRRKDHYETTIKQTSDIQSRIIAELEALPDPPSRFWTEFEDDIIRKYYPTKGGRALVKALNRKYGTIKERASTLGVKKL